MSHDDALDDLINKIQQLLKKVSPQFQHWDYDKTHAYLDKCENAARAVARSTPNLKALRRCLQELEPFYEESRHDGAGPPSNSGGPPQ